MHFKVEGKTEKDDKVSWKDVETEVKKNFNKLKIVYSRADPLEGDLAISSNKVNDQQLKALEKAKLKVQGHDVSFHKLEGEELKSFWPYS